VTAADIRLDGLNTSLDRGVARKLCLGLAQCRLSSGFHPADEQQA
jgi:hypothetical protein